MSWDSLMPILLRNVIGDTAAAPKYDDPTLENLLLSAAQFITLRVNLPQTYTIDVENGAITPDPTDVATRDNAFINLVTLKAACMLMTTEVRIYGQQAIAIRDGTSAIDLKRDLAELRALADGFCRDLQQSITDYYHSTAPPGEAVIGPYKRNVFGAGWYGDGPYLRSNRYYP